MATIVTDLIRIGSNGLSPSFGVTPAIVRTLPIPSMTTKIYAGTIGWSDFLLPLGKEPNDGILTVSETILPSAQLQTIRASHTFIMNSKVVFNDILETINTLH